jgi:hypothetical protein
MHSVAHTADLLKFLARSPKLAVPRQAEILSAIGDKLAAVDVALTHGEDERLARAIVSIAARSDFDRAGFERWLTALVTTPMKAPSPAALAAQQNRKNLIVSLHAVLTTDPRSGLDDARTIVRSGLGKIVR